MIRAWEVAVGEVPRWAVALTLAAAFFGPPYLITGSLWFTTLIGGSVVCVWAAVSWGLTRRDATRGPRPP
jgi:hypothetical protein